jgi:DNA adenine methylase
MKYMGSKARYAKEILPIILKNRKPEQWYIEPFAGGMNMIDKVQGNRIAADNNKYLIAMWDGLMQGMEYPTEIPKDFYADVRDCFNGKNTNYDDFMIGWVGFMASANGRFFEGGYSGKSNTKIGTVRDYVAEGIRNIQKQIPLMQGTKFIHTDYLDIEMPKGSIVYCDIPYQGTKQYATSKGFDHDQFWDWVRRENSNYEIFVSEYAAPNDFECVWEKKARSSLSANGKIGGSKISTEKLFRYCG